MEPKQPNQIKNLTCLFSDDCNIAASCDLCNSKGPSYLIKKQYLPKTLIPQIYLNKKPEELDLIGGSMEAAYYIDNVWALANNGKGMYCWSEQTGTGKTTMGIIALRRYLFKSVRKDPYDTDNRRVLYLNIPEFLDRLRKSYSTEDQDLDKLMEELMNATTAPKLILLDDIGAEKSTPWVMERIYSLLNFRSSNGLATMFTSNVSIDRLESQLGSRIASRIRGAAKELKFSGRDHRGCEW